MDLIKLAKDVVDIEIQGLKTVKSNFGNEIFHIVETILTSSGRVIICGMGKSGLIGKKIVASLASTGTPSFFMHPGEAFHGDLGMVKSEDTFIALSNSGETDEILKILPFLKDNKNILISITGNKNSTLAKHSDYHINAHVPEEACPFQLAPTASTTAALVIGDVLTIILMKARGFQPENFARFHPGGSLGKRLLSKVRDEMISDNLPFITPDASFIELIAQMTTGQLGMALVKDSTHFIGVVTDGDLRRAMEKHQGAIFNKIVLDLCSTDPVYISPESSMQTAIDFMTEHKVNTLIVKDEKSIVGVLKK